MKEIVFNDFLGQLKTEESALAEVIDGLFMQGGCKREIKKSASGYTVSYLSAKTKKTLANFVCRKTGLKIRLMPPKPFECDDMVGSLPDNMRKDMTRGNECKRLSGADVCNPRCQMGYSFTVEGEKYNKCRSMAFLFAVTEKNLDKIIVFINRALAA